MNCPNCNHGPIPDGARCIFLQKVGGGYIFIHRYLQEHFAELRGAEQQIARAPSPDD